MTIEDHFTPFRHAIIGIDQRIPTVDSTGEVVPKRIIYADWIASGRLYAPIERYMTETIGPYIANTHTGTTYTGSAMTQAYHDARETIKRHVHASEQDCLFLVGSGMTAAVNKLQRILGLRLPEGVTGERNAKGQRPMVLITHMEHHSNQITWSECDVDLRIVPPDERTGLPDLGELRAMAKQYQHRPLLIGAFTACSNVTGIMTPYHEMAEIMHTHGGVCFIDFAASAPYVDIDMHPDHPDRSLDAIMFSPHKFLGGPGSSGVLIMNRKLYHTSVPDLPGGGTVKWTTPFGTHKYYDDIEAREDGGTPGFLQAIRAALAIRVKEAMGTSAIHAREEELKHLFMASIAGEPSIYLLESKNLTGRLPVFSLYVQGMHHNLIVRLLNDRYGIQTRGGCSCAGTYGHILFHIDKQSSRHITEMIDHGDLTEKPGWVRISLHPTMTDEEVMTIGQALKEIIRQHRDQLEQGFTPEYVFDPNSGEYVPTTVPAIVTTPPELLALFDPVPPAGGDTEASAQSSTESDPGPWYISELTPEDLPGVLDLWKSEPHIGLSRADELEKLVGFLQRNSGLCLAARSRQGGEVIGTILCGEDGRRGYLYHQWVDPSWRRVGIGRQLVDTVGTQLRRRGIDKAHLFIFSNNRPGKVFWERIGWNERMDLSLFSKDL